MTKRLIHMEVNNHKPLIVPRKCKALTPYETHNEVGAINTRNLGDFDPKVQQPRPWYHWQVLETVTSVGGQSLFQTIGIGIQGQTTPTSCPPGSSTVPVVDCQRQL